MKYEFSFNPSRGYICIRTYGEASVRGFEKLMTEIADSPNWKPGTNLLIDHRKLNSRNFSSDEMDRACIEMPGDHRPARTRDRGKRSSETGRPGHDISDCRLKRLMPEWREKPVVYPGKG